MVTAKHLVDQLGGQLWTISAEHTVFEAIQLMAEKAIGALIVMDEGKLAGILSERDYTRKVALMNRSSKSTRVEEIMTREVITVSQSASIEECMLLMSRHSVRHLPVIDDQGKVCGVISILNVLKGMLSDKEFEIQQLESYISGSA